MRTRFGMRARKATSLAGVAAFSMLAVAFAFPVEALAAAAVPQAPTVVTPTDGAATTSRQPLITGVTVNGSRVAVLVDGEFHGFATVVDDPSGTAHFAFTPSLALLAGEHELRVRAESRETSHWGGTSSPTTFVVELAVPAPALLDTVTTASANRPVVRGLAHTDTVKVYVDGTFDGRAAVKDRENGVGNFAYTPSRSLSSGTHEVEVRAVDTRGRESVLSSALAVAVPTAEAATTETGSSDESEETSTSSEPTTTDESTKTGDEVVAGVTDQSEESEEADDTSDETADDTAAEESDEAAADDESDKAAADDESTKDDDEDGVNRSVVTWVIVLAVLIILAVLRFRGGGDGGMGGGSPFRGKTGGSGQGGGTPPTGGTPTGGTGSPSTGQKNDSMPNPPPPSSNY